MHTRVTAAPSLTGFSNYQDAPYGGCNSSAAGVLFEGPFLKYKLILIQSGPCGELPHCARLLQALYCVDFTPLKYLGIKQWSVQSPSEEANCRHDRGAVAGGFIAGILSWPLYGSGDQYGIIGYALPPILNKPYYWQKPVHTSKPPFELAGIAS